MAKEETQEAKPKNVYACIAAVSKDLAVIGCAKDRKNAQQGWVFRSIDDVYNAVASLLPQHGLVIIPSVLTRECIPIESGGKRIIHAVVSVQFSLISISDGSKHECVFFGEAMDFGDKATGKAMTYAHKAMLLETFCIPTEASDDPDKDAFDSAPSAKPVEKPAAKEVKPATISEEEEITIREMLDQIPDDSRAKFFETFKVKKISEIRVIDYTRAVSRLRATIGAKGGK